MLAGRIFFKEIRYHGDNETVFVHGGYITWRYWLPSVKECQYYSNRGSPDQARSGAPNEKPNGKKSEYQDAREWRPESDGDKVLPCRITVEVTGVEAFLYNRSPAYDWIVQGIQGYNSTKQGEPSENEFTLLSEKSGYRGLDKRRMGSFSSNSSSAELSNEGTNGSSSQGFEKPNLPPGAPKPAAPAFLRLLPVAVHCRKGAAVLGNENTETVITAKFDTAGGEFDASRAGPLDIFKILMGFEVSKIYVQMKPNMDYRRQQLLEADILKGPYRDRYKEDRHSSYESNPRNGRTSTEAKNRRWSKVPGLSSEARSSLDSIATHRHVSFAPSHLPNAATHNPAQAQWHGLSRYLQENQQDEHDEWDPMEYAKASTIADISKLIFKFYWDIAGPRPYNNVSNNFLAGKFLDVNGHKPPEYGMELVVCGGRVNYGPWADRHRVNLQQIFFPMPFSDARPTPSLQPGEIRLCTIFKLCLVIKEDTVLRVPFREPSRDWKWKGRAANISQEGLLGRRRQNSKTSRTHKRSQRNRKQKGPTTGADVRPFAWFDIKVKPGSTINYSMDMFPGVKGYKNKLNVDITSIDIFSSLNHALLWKSKKISMLCDLSNPLAWNGLRQWVFDIHIHDLDLFMLRDHTFLLIDLIADWSAGPVPAYWVFVPYRYMLNVHFHDSKLYLNVNDANIVNNSDDIDDNDFVILYSQVLEAELVVPLDRFRPPQNEISFDVNGQNLGFRLCLPAKNTQNILLENKDLAQLEKVDLKGAYAYCNEVKPGLTETLNLDIVGKGFTIAFYGFFGRQLAKIKENYFGEDLHFKTLEEFQILAERNFEGSKSPQVSLKSNDLDVILDITAEDAKVIVPAGFYDAQESLELTCDIANVDLRVSNYFLELMVNSSPLGLRHTSKVFDATPHRVCRSGREIFIDGVKVYGHRLFGLPPMEPPYVSNWDIDVGDIIGHCSPNFIGKVVAAAQAVAISLGDEENALSIPQINLLHDSTFVRFRNPMIRIYIDIDQCTILCALRNTHGNFNDWSGEVFSQHLRLNVAQVFFACHDNSMASEQFNRGAEAETHACIKTALSVEMVQRAPHFKQEKRLQGEFMASHDRRTKRATFLPQDKSQGSTQADQVSENFTASIPLPKLPAPLNESVLGSKDIRAPSDPSENLQNFSTHDHYDDFDSNSGIYASAHTEGSFGLRPKGVDKPESSTDVGGIFDPLHRSGPADSRRVNIKSTEAHAYRIPPDPMKDLHVNLDDVPTLPGNRSSQPESRWQNNLENEIFDRGSNETAVHTSVIIQARPGLVAMFKPQAICSVIDLLQIISPKDPDQILDRYQYATMSELLASYSRRNGMNSILDIRVDVPQVRFRCINTFSIEKDAISREKRDIFNVQLQTLACVARVKSMPEHKHKNDIRALHLTLGSVSVAAHEDLGSADGESVAFRALMDDVLLWLADGEQTTIHGSYRLLDAALSSSKVSYLASLVHRTTILADDLQHRITNIIEQQKARLRFLVYQLVALGEEIADPSFLTRPTYVLRSTKNHIRNADSWKIVLRLRYVLLSLSAQEKSSLSSRCTQGHVECPAEAESYVSASLDQWRSWDAIHVKDSVAMRVLFGKHGSVDKFHERGATPLSATLRGSGIRLRVDSGGAQSAFGVDDLAVYVSITPPPPPSALQFFHDVQEQKFTTVQIDTSRVVLQLNWGICELADRLLTLFEKQGPHDIEFKNLNESSATADLIATDQFHVVYASQNAMIGIETLNMIQELSSEGLKFSVTGTGATQERTDMSINALASAQNASITMRTHESLVYDSEVKQPNLWVSVDRQTTEDQVLQIIQIAGGGEEVSMQIADGIPAVLGIVEKVLLGECAELKSLVSRHSGFLSTLQSTGIPETRHVDVKFNVGLFLNHYRLKVAIMDDVDYITRGRSIRLAINPNKDLDSSWQADFDLKAQTHCLEERPESSHHVLAKIEIPSINGTLGLMIAKHVVKADARISVENISIDGADVYGIMSVLSLPAFTNMVGTTRSGISDLSRTYQTIFPASQEKPGAEKPRRKAVIFDGNAVLAGISISVREPKISPDHTAAQLVFIIGSTQTRAANRSAFGDTPLPFPEIRLVLGRTEAVLQSLESERTHSCGKATFEASLVCAVDKINQHRFSRSLKILTAGPELEMSGNTAPGVARLISHLQDRVKKLNLSADSYNFEKYQRPKAKERKFSQPSSRVSSNSMPPSKRDIVHFVNEIALDLQTVRISYIDSMGMDSHVKPTEHLAFTIKSINLATRSEEEARLRIDDLRLQLLPQNPQRLLRPSNSAVLPEVLFTVTQSNSKTERRLFFQAVGKVLDVQIDTQFPLPASQVADSISRSIDKTRSAAGKITTSSQVSVPRKSVLFGKKRLSLLIVEANFAGAIIRVQHKRGLDPRGSKVPSLDHGDGIDHGRFGQFVNEGAISSPTLHAPGIATKIQFNDPPNRRSSFDIEIRVDSSNNEMKPTVGPVILQLYNNVREAMRMPESSTGGGHSPRPKPAQKRIDEGAIVQTDPRDILGRAKLNVGFRICKQEFTLSCQPHAKIAANMKLEDTYITINNLESTDSGRFFALSATFSGLNTSLKHAYSREATFSFNAESVVLSLMNSKHISGVSGISAILKLNPTKAQVNAKQWQDILLFREIWLPPEARNRPSSPASPGSLEPQDIVMHRYQQIAAAAAFPWNATIAIAELALELDLGQAIGKLSSRISNLWASSKKTTDSQQNLCVGIDKVSVTSVGRMSGFVDLDHMKVRTSIAWPQSPSQSTLTPLIQGSIGFNELQAKAAFDYQAFAIAHVTSFEFIMYNVRDRRRFSGDRLVAILDGDKVRFYCTALSAALGLSLVQAFERLIQEKRASYDEAIKDIEKLLRRKSSLASYTNLTKPHEEDPTPPDEPPVKTPISLHTDVVVTIASIQVGAFPRTFVDTQLLKLEASNVQARFDVSLSDGKIHSGLGLTLGQVLVALSSVPRGPVPKTLGDLSTAQIVGNATAARGGIILRVPRVVATMQTWQAPEGNAIDYIFKSTFEGKIDVGWNYSRISFIRGMWATHSRSLAARLGKPLPESALKITGPDLLLESGGSSSSSTSEDAGTAAPDDDGKKITAVVNLPQSKYVYNALKPPVIDTPQLRDMGEATPPLEWIGLHRDRLPNVTHQIVIVTLLEVAKEVEDAYSRILGSA